MQLQGALYQRFEAAWREYAPPRELGRHQPLGRPRGHGSAALEGIPPLGAMGAAGDAHRPFPVPHQPAEGDREAGGEGDDDVAVVVVARGADVAPTAGQIAKWGADCPVARRCSLRGRGRKPWGLRPGLAALRLVRARGGGGGVSLGPRR